MAGTFKNKQEITNWLLSLPDVDARTAITLAWTIAFAKSHPFPNLSSGIFWMVSLSNEEALKLCGIAHSFLPCRLHFSSDSFQCSKCLFLKDLVKENSSTEGEFIV